MHKSVQKSPKIFISKMFSKTLKIPGGWGLVLFWTKSKLKLHFLGSSLIKEPIRSQGVKERVGLYDNLEHNRAGQGRPDTIDT